MSQQAIDRELFEYCIRNIDELEDMIFKAQQRLEFYKEMRDLLATQLGEELE